MPMIAVDTHRRTWRRGYSWASHAANAERDPSPRRVAASIATRSIRAMISRPMANITPTASDTSSSRPSLPNTSCTWPGRWTSLTATTRVVDRDERQRAPLGPREPVQRDAGGDTDDRAADDDVAGPGRHVALGDPRVHADAGRAEHRAAQGEDDEPRQVRGAEEQPGGEQQHGDDGDEELDQVVLVGRVAAALPARPQRRPRWRHRRVPVDRLVVPPAALAPGAPVATERADLGEQRRGCAAPRTKPRKPGLTVECPAAPASAGRLVARPRAGRASRDRHAAVTRASRRSLRAGAGCGTRRRRRCACRSRRRSSRRCSSSSSAPGSASRRDAPWRGSP